MFFIKKILGVINQSLLRFFNCKIKFKGIGLIPFNSHFNIRKGIFSGGRKFIMANNSEIRCYGKLDIGHNFCLNSYSRIMAHEKISIGNNVTIAQFVCILDHDHKYKFINNELKLGGYTTSPIKIGNNVWIADKVTILKGVTIGDNVIIGANSLVNKDVQSNSIVGGVPAKLIKLIDEKNTISRS